MKKRLLGFCLAVLLLLIVPISVSAEYIHGYFRYIVEDESVTITAYYGVEDVVTVPAMIGGNPVNTIAAGAFSGCSTVTTVYLPDTIMTIEEGAFSSEQTVVYSETDTKVPHEEATDGSGQMTPTPAGIYDEKGNLITTDDDGNLVLVDPEGNETVLDDTQGYTLDTDEKGRTVIQGVNGETVTVAGNGEISFTDGQQNQITVSIDGVQIISSEQSTAVDETTVDPNKQETSTETVPSSSNVIPSTGPVSSNAKADELSQPKWILQMWVIVGLCVVTGGLIIAVLVRKYRGKA